jgi:hypothetical protein
MDPFNVVAVGYTQDGRFGQEPLGPVLMHGKQPEQPCAMRQVGKQRAQVPPNPTIKGAFPHTFEGEEDA